MDGALPSRFPHLTWLGYAFEAPAGSGPHCWNLQGHSHSLHFVFQGRHPVRWINRGRETHYAVREGSFHYLYADDESHTIVARPGDAIRSFTLFVPRRHLADIAASDHLERRGECDRLLVHDDPVLRICMTRLARPAAGLDADAECGREKCVRRLILRLAELSGGGTPDWHDDANVFDRLPLANLVASVDERLHVVPSLGDMAVRTGLSPSHFAKKFRRAVG